MALPVLAHGLHGVLTHRGASAPNGGDRDNLNDAGLLALLYVRTEVLAFRRSCKYVIAYS
jgi:hypothetical protein